MCIDYKKFLELCDIFPQTKANIKRIALARRYRFMQEKYHILDKVMEEAEVPREAYIQFKADDKEYWYPNELPDNQDQIEQESVNMHIQKLNKRAD